MKKLTKLIKFKSNKGITLIALIITVIVLVVLATVVVNLIFNENGIKKNVEYAEKEYIRKQAIEEMEMLIADKQAQIIKEIKYCDLKLLADYLVEDERELIEYLETESMVASLKKVNAVDKIFVKLKKYNYEFEIQDKLKIVNVIEIVEKINPNKKYDKAVALNDGLLGVVSKVVESNENQEITLLGNNGKNDEEVTYNADVIYYDGNMVFDGVNKFDNFDNIKLEGNVYSIGNINDVATANTNAKNTVILRVNGDITINSDITVTAVKSPNSYGGPKGLVIYCSGTLYNEGKISMTARGAKANGQNVYVWKNSNGSFEFIPAIGAEGATKSLTRTLYNDGGNWLNGNTGTEGTGRKTGGGGSGAVRNYVARMYPGSGGAGTSYSGGAGGGAAATDRASSRTAGDGSSTGGAGGHGAQGGAVTGSSGGSTNGWGQVAGGGQGNGPGNNVWSHAVASVPAQETGTGGLLIIYANKLNNQGIIEAKGVKSRYTSVTSWNGSQRGGNILSGGSSGGGSINIFYNKLETKGNITADGGEMQWQGMSWAGGAGGKGSVSIGCIENGDYAEYIEPVESEN